MKTCDVSSAMSDLVLLPLPAISQLLLSTSAEKDKVKSGELMKSIHLWIQYQLMETLKSKVSLVFPPQSLHGIGLPFMTAGDFVI